MPVFAGIDNRRDREGEFMNTHARPLLASFGWTLCVYGLVETLARSNSWPVRGVGPGYYMALVGVSLLGWIWAYRRRLILPTARFLVIAAVLSLAIVIEPPLGIWLYAGDHPFYVTVTGGAVFGSSTGGGGIRLVHPLVQALAGNLGWFLLGGWMLTTTALLLRDPSANSHSNPILCPACGYDMRGLTHTTCPECGKEHTLDQFILPSREEPTLDRRVGEEQPRTQ